MNPLLVKLLLAVAQSTTIRRLVLELLDGLSHRSDNDIDDEFVHAAARALDIRIPDHGTPAVPDNGNIFLGDEELTQIKAARPERLTPEQAAELHEEV